MPVRHDGTVMARPGARASVTLDAAVTQAVIAQAKRRGVTTFTWLLACVQLFLSRIYSGRSPIIGLPFANRTTRLKELVGNCVNLPFVVPAPGDDHDFESALAFTREAMSKLMNHSRFPYSELCELFRERVPDSNASPVEITFNLEPMTHMPAFGEGAPKLVAPINQWIEFDLMFNVFLLPDGTRIELDYNRDLLKADVTYGWLYLLAKLIENEATAEQPSELSV
jgi:non-ribosomal peptide synthetase component F